MKIIVSEDFDHYLNLYIFWKS